MRLISALAFKLIIACGVGGRPVQYFLIGESLLPGTSRKARQEFPLAHHRAIRTHRPSSPVPRRLVRQSSIHVRSLSVSHPFPAFTNKVFSFGFFVFWFFQVPGAVGRRQRLAASVGARKNVPCADRGS